MRTTCARSTTKIFPSPTLPVLAELNDCLDDLVGQAIDDGDFDFCLGDELDGILGTPIDLGVPTLPAKAANFGDSDALHAHVADCLANIIELERFYNGGN